jgi:chromosomal replication initiation ATPase DnaA
VEPERLLRRGERGLHARNMAMWMIWESGSLTLREIGEFFGGLDYAAVAQRIRRTRLACKPATKAKLLGEMLNV